MYRHITQTISLILLISFVVIFANVSYAFKERTEKQGIEALEFRADELYISQSNTSFAQLASQLRNSTALQSLLEKYPGSIYIDPRSGRPSLLTSSIPIIPGTGDRNTLTLKEVSARLGYTVSSIGEKEVRAIIQKFINEYAAALDINPKEISTVRVTNIDYLWNVNAQRKVNEIPVKDALLSISINHGNINIWGVEKWGDIVVNLQPSLTKETAVNLGFSHIGGLTANDNIVDEPHLLLVPVNSSGWNGIPGKGYDYKLVWAFTFQRAGYNNTWEIYVDAHSGKVLKFEDQNVYIAKRITGPIYPVILPLFSGQRSKIQDTKTAGHRCYPLLHLGG